MGNRNGTVFLALFALATAIAIAACSGGSSTVPGALAGGDRAAQSQAHTNWGGSHGANPNAGQPSPYPTTNGETWDFNNTLTASTKVTGKKGVVVSNTTGTSSEFYTQGSEEYSTSASYTTTQKNSNVIVFGSSSRNVFVSYDASGGSCQAAAGDTCFDETSENGSGTTTNSNGGSSSTSYSETPYTVFTMDELITATGAEVGQGTTFNDATGYSLSSSGSFIDAHGNTTTTSSSYARNPDGSYSDSQSVSTTHGSWTNTSSQSSGGNATLTNNGGGPTAGTTTWGIPFPQNGHYVIPVHFVPTHGGTQNLTPSDWYPGNGPTPPLWTDTTTDLGPVTVPRKCGTDAGDIAELLSERSTFIDVVNGTYSQNTSQRYVVSNQGVICVDSTRLLDTYDNYNTGNLLKQERVYALQALTSFTPSKWHPKVRSIRGFSVR